jgi:hypothetical protein
MKRSFKRFVCTVGALVLVVASPAAAGDIEFKPIDTQKLVIQPSRTSATLAARTIDSIGQFAAGAIDNNGYVKTINNLFGKKIIVPHTQSGPSPLPSPNLFPSTHYKNYNTPVMPVMQRIRR